MKSASAALFDEAYYQRFYFDKKTSVVDPQHVERLGTFVCSYLKYLRVPVHRVLDMGCGIGLWKDIVAQHFPLASYQGVEFSPYLCERFGWRFLRCGKAVCRSMVALSAAWWPFRRCGRAPGW